MTIVEDAFALARSGNYRFVSDIAKALKSRGHQIGWIEEHLSGRQIRAELTHVCRQAASDALTVTPDQASKGV